MLKYISIIFLCIILTSCSYTNNTSSSPITSPNDITNNQIESPSQSEFPNKTEAPSTSKINSQVQIQQKINENTLLKVPTASNWRKINDLPILKETVANKEDIIPDGWSILDILENDFNSDGLADIIGVLDHPLVDDEMYPRVLFVYFE